MRIIQGSCIKWKYWAILKIYTIRISGVVLKTSIFNVILNVVRCGLCSVFKNEGCILGRSQENLGLQMYHLDSISGVVLFLLFLQRQDQVKDVIKDLHASCPQPINPRNLHFHYISQIFHILRTIENCCTNHYLLSINFLMLHTSSYILSSSLYQTGFPDKRWMKDYTELCQEESW